MLIKALWRLIVHSRWLLLCIGVICLGSLLLFLTVLWPAYKDPGSKMYDSSLGYAALVRRMKQPFPVVTAPVDHKTFTRTILAEGICSSEPYLVPVIPMARVEEIRVREGDRVKKGDLLIRMDRTKAEIKWESAKLALSTAQAELNRVIAGSAYVLAQERPDREKINIDATKQKADNATEKVTRYREAFRKGIIARTALLEIENEFTEAIKENEMAKLFMAMSEKGVKESRLIAENAVRDAQEAIHHREAELAEHDVFATVDGIIERILIRASEYNQESGKPGLVIAKDMWFDGYFDQVDYPWVIRGLKGRVILEAYPGIELEATTRHIIPIVSFSQGGPEINRPLRPRGTGSPEWAATFRVEMNFADFPQGVAVTPGMTGFVRIQSQRTSMAIPRRALTSVSAGTGYVYVMTPEGKHQLRAVTVGMVDETAAEIFSGLEMGEKVICYGHWGLKDTDRVTVTSENGWNP